MALPIPFSANPWHFVLLQGINTIVSACVDRDLIGI
jgi:hypothetical protein